MSINCLTLPSFRFIWDKPAGSGPRFNSLTTGILLLIAPMGIAHASILEVNFSGVLNSTYGSTVNYFEQNPGSTVHGQFRIDQETLRLLTPPNINAVKSAGYGRGTTQYGDAKINSGFKQNWIQFKVPTLNFDFSNEIADERSYDYISVGSGTQKDGFTVVDEYNRFSSTSGACGNLSSPSVAYCWRFKIEELPLQADTFAGAGFPQQFSYPTDGLAGSATPMLTFTLQNTFPEYGAVGLMKGNISLQSVSVAPVPLPAAAWLFLSALGGGYLVTRRRRQPHLSLHLDREA